MAKSKRVLVLASILMSRSLSGAGIELQATNPGSDARDWYYCTAAHFMFPKDPFVSSVFRSDDSKKELGELFGQYVTERYSLDSSYVRSGCLGWAEDQARYWYGKNINNDDGRKFTIVAWPTTSGAETAQSAGASHPASEMHLDCFNIEKGRMHMPPSEPFVAFRLTNTCDIAFFRVNFEVSYNSGKKGALSEGGWGPGHARILTPADHNGAAADIDRMIANTPCYDLTYSPNAVQECIESSSKISKSMLRLLALFRED